MNDLINELEKIREEFLAPYTNCNPIINDFYEDMCNKKTLRMLNTYIFLRDSIKEGEYLALDFGGSNIRVSLYHVGQNIELKDIRSFPLRGEGFDYTTSEYSLTDIFQMAVDKMKEIIDPSKTYLLGHTFSFATKTISKNTAEILELSKGFEIRDAVGNDVNKVLKEVIDKNGLKVMPVAIINDCTATLLSGIMNSKNTIISSIIGTGHNMCFINSDGEVINIESGSYNSQAIPLSQHDKKFLEMIPNEKEFLMEALVGGKNSLILVKLIMDYIADNGLINPISTITYEMISTIMVKDLADLDERQNYAFRRVTEILYNRVAYLIGCEIVAVLKYLKITKGNYNVVFDGSVYEKIPYVGKTLTDVLDKLLSAEIKVTHTLNKNGSSMGAVIACSM